MLPEPIGESESHPTEELDEVVHQRARLGILSVLHEARRVDFGYLLKTLSLTGGNLSQHLRVLEEASLIRVEKGVQGRRPRTWVSITPAGRRALLREIAALRAIIERVDPTIDREG
jgi:DNA-binding MarR family transcriptional regulator